MASAPPWPSLLRWMILCFVLTSVYAGQKCTKKCPKTNSPVCGSDGKTYKNACKLKNRRCSDSSLQRLHDGECCRRLCGDTYEPVCGSDGVTYDNMCALENVACDNPGVSMQGHGECPRGCKRLCGDAYDPICGSDGLTYDNICELENGECDNPMLSMQGRGECPKEVILMDFQSDLVATGVTKGPSDVVFEMIVTSAPGSQSIRGRGLWKLGVYGCHYEDGWCDKIGHIPQILSEEQASTELVGGQQMVIQNIVAHFDVSIIGCDDLPYICTEFGKGDNPRPGFTLTMGFFDTVINCWRLECHPLTVTDPPVVTQACRYQCPESGHVVCGNDGKTYNTECALDNERRCGEDPDSYLLTRKHYGPCRIGVIIDSMFWSGEPIYQEDSSQTLISVEVLVISNSTGESISGRNLWRVGLYGSQFADGSGPRLGYIKQMLDSSLASTTLAAGRAIVFNAEAEFDVAAVGCSRYEHLCLEFTKGDSAQPPFPFHGNAGPEDNSVFMSCQQVPCTTEPEPDDGRLRVVIGPLNWGLKARGLRADGLYDVILNVKAQIEPESDYVSGSNLLRVGLFGSQNQDGSGPRLGFQRQTLASQDIPNTLAPSSNLLINDIETKFPVTALGCSDYGFLCLELVKDDGASPDFIFVSENTDTTTTEDAVVLCKEIPCSNPDGGETGGDGGGGGGGTGGGGTGGGGGGASIGKIRSFKWRLSIEHFNSPKPSDLAVQIVATPHATSDVITGDGLWRAGLYASEDSDPMGAKYRYQPQILSDEQQAIPLTPDTPMDISGISAKFNVQGLGCGQLNFICLEFTKGNSPQPDFQLPLPQNDNDGVTKRISSCKPWPCQDGDSGTEGGTGGGTGGHGGGMGGQDGAGGRGGGAGGHGGGGGGGGGGSMGGGGGGGGHGGGSVGGGGGGGSHGGGGGGGGGGGSLSVLEEDPPFVAFRNLHWGRQILSFNPGGPSMINVVLTLTPSPSSDPLQGFNLWKVGLFGSDVSDNTGARFDERTDVLSTSDRSSELVPVQPLVFNITTPFEMRGVGCGNYPYLCIEFTRDEFSWPTFRLALGTSDSVVSCQQVACDPNAGQGRNPNRGHGGTLDPNLPTASFHNISWTASSGDTLPGVPTDLSISAIIFPKSYADKIKGRRLWRLGLFGNQYRDGSGADRIGYVSQILSPKQAKTPLVPGTPLEFDVDTRFLLHNFGCDLHRYLCIEFAQHENPNPEFNFPVENGAHVSCRPHLCQEPPQPEHNPNQPVALIQTFTWRMEPSEINPEGPTKLRLFADVTPDQRTDIISGENLWKIGIYGSRNRGGGEPFEERLNYDPQLLQVHDARRVLAPTRSLNFDVHTEFDLWRLGCGPFKYFCVEFGKDHLADPDFEMALANGDLTVNCQRVACQPTRGTGDTDTTGGQPDHTGSQPDSSPLKIAGFIHVDWRILTPTIYSDGQSDLDILVELTPHPNSDAIVGSDGSGFWRIGIYANRNEDGTHAQKLNYDRQTLSQEDRDQNLLPPNPLNFDIRVPFDLRRANCESEFPFLCLEIAKGDSAHPDFNLPLPDGALSLVTCQRAPCLPETHQGGHVDTEHYEGDGHGHLPVVTVTTVNIGGININPDARNDVQLDTIVYMSPDSPAIRGNNLWRLEMWASALPDGSGPRVAHVDQVLPGVLIDRNFVPPEPLFFPAIPFTLDMTGRECWEVTHVCGAFSKLESSNPEFELEADPNASVLTVCRPVECYEPRNPQIAVTGLSLFHSASTTVYAGRPNRMLLGVRVNYDEPDSVGFEGTDLWGLKLWLAPKSNGKGKKLGAVKQALSDEHAAQPLVVGQDLEFEDISFSANLLGKKCKDGRFICATLYKNAGASTPYVLIARPNAKKLTKCIPINCA